MEQSPKSLEPFLDGTPLAVERLKLAWPGLSTTDKACLLMVLLADTSNEGKALRWPHNRNRLVDLALTDENSYIRYLAAKHVSTPYKAKDVDETPSYLEDKARFDKVQSDSVGLVRSANEEHDSWKATMGELENAESFWIRPQTERLILVNGVEERGEEIAELLRHATKHLLPIRGITVDEMFDVLLQYLGGRTIAERVADSEDHAERFYDGFAAESAGKSVEALWKVIPDIPRRLSPLLIECLPEKAGFQSHISPQVIESLDDPQLELLLCRDDVELTEFRRKLYKESTNDRLRGAAVTSQQFELLDSDISELLYDSGEPVESGKRKINDLAMLAKSCRGATLVQMHAICELINDAPTDFHSGFGEWDAVGFGEMLQTERAKHLPSDALRYEVLAKRFFALAKELAPIKKDVTPGDLPATLNQHKDLIVPYNPWQTYLNLRKVVRLDRWKQTIGWYLPRIYIRDVDLPENEPADNAPEDSTGVSEQDRAKRLAWDLDEMLKMDQSEIDRILETRHSDSERMVSDGKYGLRIVNVISAAMVCIGVLFLLFGNKLHGYGIVTTGLLIMLWAEIGWLKGMDYLANVSRSNLVLYLVKLAKRNER